MIKEFFDFFNGSDLPVSMVIACIIIFIIFLYGATISNKENKKDFKHNAHHDETV